MTRYGIDFTRYDDNPLLSVSRCDPWDGDGDPMRTVPGAIHPSVLYFPDGVDGYRFWMIYTPSAQHDLYPERAPEPPVQAMASDWWWERCTLVRSNDGMHWEKTGDYTNPLIDPGDAGSWDWAWHCDPDVVYTPDRGPGGRPRWFLYYCGCSPAGTNTGGVAAGRDPAQMTHEQSIGLAISDDGVHYTKVGEDGPLKGHVFASDQWYTRSPACHYDAATGKFHMWYNWGFYDIGYATSDDGIHWTPYNPDSPGEWGYVVLRPTPGTFDAHGVTHPDVIYHDSQYWMYYYAMAVPDYVWLQIGLATSPDGVHWTKHNEPILMPGAHPWEDGSLYRASPVVVGDEIHLYYTGMSNFRAYPMQGSCEIGLAVSSRDRSTAQ